MNHAQQRKALTIKRKFIAANRRNGLTYAQIATLMGISRQRAHEIHKGRKLLNGGRGS